MSQSNSTPEIDTDSEPGEYRYVLFLDDGPSQGAELGRRVNELLTDMKLGWWHFFAGSWLIKSELELNPEHFRAAISAVRPTASVLVLVVSKESRLAISTRISESASNAAKADANALAWLTDFCEPRD